MLGKVARTVPGILLAAVVVAIVPRVMDPLIGVITESPDASSDTAWVSSMQAASNAENLMLVAIVATLLGIIGRAMVEARL